MTKPGGAATEAENDDVSPSWGTWEELILAFAVNRHGTASWDSISSELQKRTSDPNLSLTPRNCRFKYLDLKRRYLADDPDGSESSVDDSAAPLLEELRKLRVAELRREVQRYDLNIESLELKVKSMEEERQKKTRREKDDSDLEIKSVVEKRGDEPDTETASGGDRVLGEESEKDQLSVNESNSTDPEAERLGTGEKEPEPGGTGSDADRTGKTSEEPDRKSAREDSCNGSSNSIEKNEPEAVSRGGEDAAKDNSDVQSTASRSRKEEGEGRSDQVRRGNTSGDEIDQYRAVKEFSAQSQPLFDFLQAIRAHKLGSTIERRLRSQQTSVYQKLILQHMDLETVETRLRQGWYSSSGSGASPRTKFFRDLLLLANNALVFFPRKSAECHAANEIRTLVSKETTHKKARSDSSSVKQASLQSLSLSKKPEEPDELSNPLMLKPRIPGSLIVCRKRSSIAAKASSSDKKKAPQQKTLLLATEEKEPKKSPSGSEETKITRKRTRDNRIPSSTSPAPPANNITKKNNIKNNNQASNNNPKQQGGKGGGGSSSENPKGDSNKKSQSDSKKRGAAIFLNRMKQGSSSSNNNGALLDALKSTPLVTNEGGKRGAGSSEQKKNENVKRGEKDQVTRKSAAEMTRQTKEKEKEKEKGSPGKRNVGRPPKRGAAAAVLVPPPAAGKRGRERGETETPPGKQQPKKRLRKEAQ